MATTKIFEIDWLHKDDVDLSEPRRNLAAAATLNNILPYIKPDFWVYVKTTKI
jgi:hypothetical protein